ncbi:hypothetical protein [Trinickia dinghuensis]|nr:hypothetical protein [Trinickia dinghuensis]
MRKRTTHADINRSTMLVGMWCGLVAAACACLLALVVFGPDAINVFFGG